MRYSDDGEPGGTAGLPIIEVMKARGVVNCAVVVARYFGGILLGARQQSHYAQGSKRAALDAAGVVVMERARAIWSRWIIPLGSWNIFSAPPVIIEHTEFGASVVCTLMVRVSTRKTC